MYYSVLYLLKSSLCIIHNTCKDFCNHVHTSNFDAHEAYQDQNHNYSKSFWPESAEEAWADIVGSRMHLSTTSIMQLYGRAVRWSRLTNRWGYSNIKEPLLWLRGSLDILGLLSLAVGPISGFATSKFCAMGSQS